MSWIQACVPHRRLNEGLLRSCIRGLDIDTRPGALSVQRRLHLALNVLRCKLRAVVTLKFSRHTGSGFPMIRLDQHRLYQAVRRLISYPPQVTAIVLLIPSGGHCKTLCIVHLEFTQELNQRHIFDKFCNHLDACVMCNRCQLPNQRLIGFR